MLVLVLSAAAQSPPEGGFDAHGFRLAAHDADPRDPLVVARPGAFEAQSWFLSGLVEYASQPLVFQDTDGTTVKLDDLLALNLSTGYAPHQRLRVDLALPVFLAAQGDARALGAGFGDLRATGMMVLAAPEDDGGVGLALVGNLDLPTGRPDAWLGQWTLAGGVGMAATWEGERATVSATASSQIRPNTPLETRPAPTRGGDAFQWGLAVGTLVSEHTGLTVEVHGDVPTDPAVRTAVGVPVEALMSMRGARPDGGFLTAGVGAALTRGAGASPLRVVVGGGVGRLVEPFVDTDGDGLQDDADACPASPETVNGMRDDDGCPDVLPVVVVRAVDPQGAPVEDAELEATGPDIVTGAGVLELQGPASTPGVRWSVRGSSGPCLEGYAELVVPEDERSEIDVALKPRRTGKVRAEVFSPDGTPLPAVGVQVQSEDRACAPDPAVTGPDGVVVLPSGPGHHFAFISAPGYAMQRASFDLTEGAEVTLRVTLAPTRIRVEAEQIVILERVFFDTGKATIQARSHALLDEVAAAILTHSPPRVEVQGHTDDRGAASTNLTLSQARADAVRAYLISRGVADGVLVAKGYGEASPIASNAKESGRTENRRVEFKILPAEAP